MIIRRNDMQTQVRKDMKGGAGEVTVLHLVDCENLPNIRFVGEMTLPENASIGQHTHDTETEYYVINEGIGIVTEKDGEKKYRTKVRADNVQFLGSPRDGGAPAAKPAAPAQPGPDDFDDDIPF